MTHELKPYPIYKDSGVPWLGKVPEHWEVKRQRNVVQMLVSNIDKHTKEGELQVRLCNYIDVYKNDRITGSISFMRATATKDEMEQFRIQKGDVIITKDSESWTDIGVPALVEYTAPDLVCGYHLAIMRPQKKILDGSYLFRAHQSQNVAVQYHISANGVTRYGLSHDAIKSIWLPLPPLPEQLAIVRYLDYIDRRIRRYIRAKQKLIKLLNEQKQAIIQQAVTRGLDPNVRLKPSGVEWLGDVPEHWEVRRIKQISAILRGKFTHRPRNDPSLYDGRYPFIQTGAVARTLKFITDYHQTLNEKGFAVSKLFPSGTLVMTIAANIGDVAILTFDACFPDSIVGFVPRDGTEQDYLFLVLRSMKNEFLNEAPINTQGNLNVERIGKMRVPIPPMMEQKDVVRFVEENTVSLDSAIAHAKREIDLLREYRTRLIADVVTGKLDVRAAAAGLPDEVEELELVEEVDELAEEGEPDEERDLDLAAEEVEA